MFSPTFSWRFANNLVKNIPERLSMKLFCHCSTTWLWMNESWNFWITQDWHRWEIPWTTGWKNCQNMGVVYDQAQAQPISLENKENLWKTGLLRDNMPEKLVNTLLYLIGVHLALHACEEHKVLKLGGFSQFKLKYNYDTDSKYLEYTEHQSKNHQGGLKSLHSKPKVVRAFENKTQLEHCLVRIFEKYIAKCPSHNPKCSKDLYLHPLAKPPNPHVWYSCQPLGLSTLSKVIAKLCDAAGMVGRYSNHSLHSTAVTRMYDQKMDEQQITEVTSHKSIAVRNYKRTSMDKQHEVSEVLYGKWKNQPSATVTKEEAKEWTVKLMLLINMEMCSKQMCVFSLWSIWKYPKVDIQSPVLNFQQPEITVSPVINLHTSELSRNDQGQIVLPPIKITLTININAP